jgi:hypothetical protein
LADHAVIPGHWKGGPSKIGDPQKQGKYEIPPKMIGKILKTNPKLPPKCQYQLNGRRTQNRTKNLKGELD